MLLPTVDLQPIRCVTMDFQPFMARMFDPSHFLTHLPYALLVLSMLMNSMGWLRARFSPEGGVAVSPHTSSTDGFYCIVMRRSA